MRITLGVERMLWEAWCLPQPVASETLRNPEKETGRMAEVNGDPEDLRDMPREVQEIGFGKGMIPYTPDYRE
jgi:hypothetical protein